MTPLNLTIPVVTLNENDLNALNKGRDYHIGLKKTTLNIMTATNR